MDRLRVLLADDHPFFRDGMRMFLETTPDIAVVGEAVTGEEAVAQADVLSPDVVLMDIKMPGMSGIEATRRILAANPGVRVLVVTMFEDDATVFTAMRAGHGATCSRTRERTTCGGRSARWDTARPSSVLGSPRG